MGKPDMFKKLLPREHRFFELFEKQTSVIKKGLDLFELLLREYSRREELTKQIKDVENDADAVAHQIYRLLNNTFVTPFDREDIQTLVNRMDDVMDLLEKASVRMEIYDMPDPPVNVGEMLVILKKAFNKLSSAVGMLRDWKHRDEIFQICVEVNSLENEGDALLRMSLEHLFKEASDPFYVIKAKEIYESLEEAIDRCEDLSNVIETIIIKNA
jgi:predicted phosphate transport protein (TIGR00153 family)